MKKRIVCALLTLILLLGMVPATALTASAASLTTSEAAITVLKQLEGYSATCNEAGYIGYHTKCESKGAHGAHKTTQSAADKALRAELATLDKAVSSFASTNGLPLTQSKHDALVLFSFQNGTSWVNGTGGFRAAVISGQKGDDFLNAILDWSNRDDDTRRKVEANMYLNGIYSISAPTNYVSVVYDANGGAINGEEVRTYSYDVSNKPQPHLVPTRKGYTFTGWYCEGKLVTSLSANLDGKTLEARWMDDSNKPWSAEGDGYQVALSQLVSQDVYNYTVDKKDNTKITFSQEKNSKGNVIKASAYATNGYLTISKEYIDKNGTKWGIIQGVALWVKLPGSTTSSSTTTTESNSIDVTVKVTNSYVNRRESASIYGTKNGSYDLGTSLRIIDTASKDGFLWGKVAKEATGTESVGWIALMYTNYDSVRNESNSYATGSVIATGFITYNGYVNVRSNAGTVNSIVGSLYKGTQVNIYETKYVNGLEWGRTEIGWFCMSYANVTRLTEEKVNGNDVNYVSYVFTGVTQVGGNDTEVTVYDAPDGNKVTTVKPGVSVTVTAFAEGKDGCTWGKISQGWVLVSTKAGNACYVKLDSAKFTVTNEVTVRNQPGNGSERINTLSVNVGFAVNGSYQVVVTGENLWGYADVLDSETSGWINLSSKYVKRDDAPTVGSTTTTTTGKIATIVGADSVRVRGDGSLSGKVIGSIKQGTTVNILGEKNGWYKIDYKCTDEDGVDSWVYGQYVQVSEGTVSGDTTGSTTTDGIGVGIIANTYGGVNLRATPGTSGVLKGKILPGTQVNILETRTVGTTKWGRVENGWICMDYVQIISDLPDDVLAALGGGNGTTGNGSSTTTGAEVAVYTGTVAAEGGVTVYAEPDKSATVIRTLGAGEHVTIHELKTVVTSQTVEATQTDLGPDATTNESDGSSSTTIVKTTTYWARVNDGYIVNPQDNLSLDTLDEAVYTVTESDTLNVRENAGTEYDKVFKLLKGDQVKVTNVKIIGGNVWGNIECDEGTGWASLAYMTKGAVSTNNGGNTGSGNANTGTTGGTTGTTGTTGNVTGSTGNTGAVSSSGYIYTGKVVNTESVRVRNTASTTATVSTNLKKGASLVIYETCISEGMAWGRCDAGWIYLYYVDLTPVNGAVDARVVYTDNTVIYSDKDGSSTVGTYCKMAVIDIYEIVGKMARTDLGWVSTDNLL